MTDSSPQSEPWPTAKEPLTENERAIIAEVIERGDNPVELRRWLHLVIRLHDSLEEQLEAAKEDRDRCGRMLLDVEGSILAYWTDIPEAECERLRVTIRHVLETLPSFEADLAAANSNPASEPKEDA